MTPLPAWLSREREGLRVRGRGETPVTALSVAALVLQVPEGQLDVLVDLIKVLPDLGLPLLEGVLELHGGQLVQDLAHGVADDLPGYLREGGADEGHRSHPQRNFPLNGTC